LIKLFFIGIILLLSLEAKECSPYYNPNKFYEASEHLIELIQTNVNQKGLNLFDKSTKYEKLQFKKENNYFISNKKHTKLNDYVYPSHNGIWKYTISENKIDEINIAQVELYQYTDTQIASELNDNFDNFWSDWTEDGYEMQLTPEQTLFRYNDKYFSFSVYIYGFKGDATPLKGTVINYWFKDYTKHVNKYIQCKKEKNDS